MPKTASNQVEVRIKVCFGDEGGGFSVNRLLVLEIAGLPSLGGVEFGELLKDG
jgi:hypothetical protein